MKLNFWQILGVLLIVGAVAYMIYERTAGSAPAAPTTPTAAPTSGPLP